MNNRLRSIAKMQWVWYALQDGRYRTRFWKWFYKINDKLNPWWDQNVRASVEDLFPLLRTCSFCRMTTICSCCILDDVGKGLEGRCSTAGKELLHWLEGGCYE